MNEKIFQDEYRKLNPEQREAVDTIEGPVMVIAGPGTGKTQILAVRIAQILRQTQTNPNNILCLTFTNSGVHAIKQRLLQIIGPASYQVHVHTFHQFCNEVIVQFPEKFLIANQLNQISDLEQIEIIQKILTAHNFSHIKPFKAPFYYQKAILDDINKLKQEDIGPEKFQKHIENELKNFEKIADLNHASGPHKDKMKGKYQEFYEQLLKNRELSKIYAPYQEEINKKGLYDYTDMILFVVSAFKKDAELLAYFQEKFQYILVDEYQDTNSAQNEVIEILGNFYENPNIFVVGDDEQSIFRFQGASLENILFFKQKFPSAKIIILEKNYRSGQEILDGSRVLILNNKNQIANYLQISKNLKSQLDSAGRRTKGEIFVGEFSESAVESFFVAKEIKRLIKSGVSPSEIAVFYRRHRDAEELIDFLSKLDIPYKLEIGKNVLEDTEIGKILKYFHALNLDDKADELLVEIMHYPYFNISPLDIYKIIVAARKAKKPIFEILADLKKYKLDFVKPNFVNKFYKTFLTCRSYCHANTFATAFEYTINHSGYLHYLILLKDNVHHFNRLQTLFEYIKQLNTRKKDLNLTGFLEHLRLLFENNIPIKEKEIVADYKGVNLMTAHKAKGLEFTAVFVIRATDQNWGNKIQKELIKLPSNLLMIQALKDDDNEDLSAEALAQEEERRLFYVALTRAKKLIYLTYAQSYGEGDNQTLAAPSQFIGEISPKFIQKIKTEKIEQSFDERLKLTFDQKKWLPTHAMRDFLNKLITDFSLNSTALNGYLACPQKFLYDHILRAPKAKDFSQSYGTAVHHGLEMFFRDYMRDLKLPAKKTLLDHFEKGLELEILDENDTKRAFQNGREILSRYYDFYADAWPKKGRPLVVELSFASHNVHFNDIPITGIIDKIELIDKNAGLVRIVDYKTSAPKSLNFLLGQTKEKNTDYLYQAYFYKLLCETDPLFGWKVGEIVFDFVAPDHGKFKQVVIPINPNDYDKFKTLVQKTYLKIVNLEFPQDLKACQKRQKPCDYLGFCQK